MKEQLIKIGKNEYCFIDEEGYEFPIELERIPYTDDEAFVETFDLDLKDVKDPVIRLEIEGLENAYENSKYDCMDWDYVNDEIEKDD